jgi:prevent-host-death family protein
MLDITKDIQSLTTFRRRSGDFMRQLRKSKRPVVLTVKGKAAAVVQDAEAYQRLLDIAAEANVHEAVRQGLDDVANGRTRPPGFRMSLAVTDTVIVLASTTVEA